MRARWVTREEAKTMIEETENLLKEVRELEEASNAKSEEIKRLKEEIAFYETKLKE